MFKRRFCFALILTLCTLCTGYLHAGTVSGTVRGAATRLTFEWAKEFPYKLKHQDQSIILTFDQAPLLTKDDIQAHIKNNAIAVESVNKDGEKLVITFNLSKPGHAQTLNKGKKVYVDFFVQDDDVKNEKKPQRDIPVPMVKPTQKKEEAEPKPEPKKEEPVLDPKVVPILLKEKDGALQIIFDFTKPVKAGAFIEGHDLWLYFDDAVQFSWNQDDFDNSRFFNSFHTFKNFQMSALFVDLNEEPGSSSFYQKGHQWIYEWPNLRATNVTNLKPKQKTEEDGQGEYITFTHPMLGTPMAADTPTTGNKRYFIPSGGEDINNGRLRRYPDFIMIPTLHGFIIDPLTTDLIVSKEGDTVTIKKPDGLFLTSIKDKKRKRTPYQPTSLFDFEEWAKLVVENENMTRKLESDIIETPKNHRTPKRLNMARYYLLTKRDFEALGVLSAAELYDPSLNTSPYYHSLAGLSYFIAEHFREAEAAFRHPSLKEDAEMQFWAELSVAAQNPTDANYAALRKGYKFCAHYPDFLRNRIALAAGHVGVAQNKDIVPFMQIFKPEAASVKQAEHLHYLLAKKEIVTGKQNDALTRLDKHSRAMKSEYGIKSKYLHIRLQSDMGKITPEEERDAIEAIRYRWTGDEHEYNIWKRLSELYMHKGDYDEALKFVRKAIKTYPHLAKRDGMQKIGEFYFEQATFKKDIEVYNAFALFNEYDMFIPEGEKGIELRENLINFLLKSDLTKQAMAHLKELLKLTGPTHKKAIHWETQMALLHLVDDKPDKTIETLNYQENEAVEKDLHAKRRLILAQAYFMKNDFQKLYEVLAPDTSEDAHELIKDSYFKEKKWSALIALIKNRQKAREGKISPQDVITLATAMMMNEDDKGIKALRKEHLDMMQDSPLAELFDVMTSNDVTDFYKPSTFLNQIQSSQKLSNFIESYKQDLREKGISRFGKAAA